MMGVNYMIRLVLDVSHKKAHKLYRKLGADGESKKTMPVSG